MPKPFNLEQAKAGKPVVTRDGRPVRIISFDGHPLRPIVGYVGLSTSPGTRLTDGRLVEDSTRPVDFMMADPAPVKVRLWVNIRKDGVPWTFRSEREAIAAAHAAVGTKPIKSYYRAVAIPTEVEYLPEE